MHPSIGSTTIRDAFISSAMVPNHFSQIVGHMRGTSHVSQTTWVGCCRNTSRERIYHILHAITHRERRIHILQPHITVICREMMNHILQTHITTICRERMDHLLHWCKTSSVGKGRTTFYMHVKTLSACKTKIVGRNIHVWKRWTTSHQHVNYQL